MVATYPLTAAYPFALHGSTHAPARRREQQTAANLLKKVRFSQEINAENVFIVSIHSLCTPGTSDESDDTTSQPEPPIDVSFEYRNPVPKFFQLYP